MDNENAPVLDTAQQTTEPTTAPTEPRTWTDAPNSANVRANVAGHDWQITIRADSFNELSKKMLFINTWLDSHNGHSSKAQTTAPVLATVAAPAPAPVPPTPAAQTQPAQVFSMTVDRMDVAPRADGKTDAKFFQAGHNYPDITATKPPAGLVAMLAQTGQWTPEHFSAVATYQVKMVIEWVNSDKINKNGKPYKNIVNVRSAA